MPHPVVACHWIYDSAPSADTQGPDNFFISMISYVCAVQALKTENSQA